MLSTVRELFEELGVLKNGQWEERYLCFTPQERLFLYGPCKTESSLPLRLPQMIETSSAAWKTKSANFAPLENLLCPWKLVCEQQQLI